MLSYEADNYFGQIQLRKKTPSYIRSLHKKLPRIPPYNFIVDIPSLCSSASLLPFVFMNIYPEKLHANTQSLKNIVRGDEREENEALRLKEVLSRFKTTERGRNLHKNGEKFLFSLSFLLPLDTR